MYTLQPSLTVTIFVACNLSTYIQYPPPFVQYINRSLLSLSTGHQTKRKKTEKRKRKKTQKIEDSNMASIPNKTRTIIYGNKYDLPIEPSDVDDRGKQKTEFKKG